MEKRNSNGCFRILARKNSVRHTEHTIVAYHSHNSEDPGKLYGLECYHKHDLSSLWEKRYASEAELMQEFIGAE